MTQQTWINDFMDRKAGKTKMGLAKALDLDPARITEIISGKRNVMSHEIAGIAKYLGIDEILTLSLLDGKELKMSSIPRKAPLISWVQAGELAEGANPYENGDFETLVNTTHQKSTVIALTVSGDSMDRIAPNGSTIIVDYADKELVDGKFYVFRVNGDGEATFKRYKANPSRLEPYSTSEFETIFPKKDMEVVGRVVETTNKL